MGDKSQLLRARKLQPSRQDCFEKTASVFMPSAVLLTTMDGCTRYERPVQFEKLPRRQQIVTAYAISILSHAAS